MYMDAARAIAVFLVVLEHMVENSRRYGLISFDGNYQDVFIIYLLKYFHIPIFMAISGILVGTGRQVGGDIRQYWRFERRKFFRLMAPYFSISIVQLLIKAFTPGRDLAEVPAALVGTLVAPHAGGMPHGWFLVSLMTIFLVWPLMKPLLDGRACVPLLCGLIILAISPIPWPTYQGRWPYFELDRTVWYLPIFLVGYLYGHRGFSNRRPGILMVLLGAMIFLVAFSAHRFISWTGTFAGPILSSGVQWTGYLAAGFCVLWFCDYLFRNPGRVQVYIARIGRFSYDIYLLHVIVGHVLMLAVTMLHPEGPLIYILPGVIAMLALFIAMGIGQVIRRASWLAFIMLGEPRQKKYNTLHKI